MPRFAFHDAQMQTLCGLLFLEQECPLRDEENRRSYKKFQEVESHADGQN